MSANRKPRKSHRPYGVLLDPMRNAKLRVSTLSTTDITGLIVPMQTAFDRLRRGEDPDFSWSQLADALNVAEVLSELGIASDRAAEITQGQKALSTLYERHQSNGKWTMTGREISALDDALLFAKAQLHYCSYGELSIAIETVKRRAQQALAGNQGRTTRVIGAIGQIL